MEEAFAIFDYLPYSFKDRREEEYINFVWESFEFNYSNEKYEFSNFAFHLLYMSYVSFSVWQIRSVRFADFEKAMIGFQKEVENKLLTAESPFKFYEYLKESNIFRFLKLIGCSNQNVGEFSKFVRQRNKIAHPSGFIFFNDKDDIDTHIKLMLTEIENIQNHMLPIVNDIFSNFLLENYDQDAWEYSSPADQINNVLLHLNYLSQKDIEFCFQFDISTLSANPNFESISELFSEFKNMFAEELETA